MMMIPRRSNLDLFEDIFNDPFFGGRETKVMKTDIKENENSYLIDIDLPGYEKENIKIDVTDGYLNIQATIDSDNEEKNEGKFVRKERYLGTCSRSFYVGDDIESEDIKAKFKNGTLTLVVPKKEYKEKIPDSKYIQIED